MVDGEIGAKSALMRKNPPAERSCRGIEGLLDLELSFFTFCRTEVPVGTP